MRWNQVIVEAGDAGGVLAQIFAWQIYKSALNMSEAPNTSLDVSAKAGLFEAFKSTAPLSFPGSADAVLIMQNLAVSNGYTFENGGVPPTMLSTPYFPGTPLAQMSACAEHAGFSWTIDNGVLAIWPRGGSRGGAVPLISPGTGMIGYPTQGGDWAIAVHARTLFNPNIRIGGKVKMESSLPFANGIFSTFDIEHTLESETPNGKWETVFKAMPPTT